MTKYIFNTVRNSKGKLFFCTWERTYFGTLESTLMISMEPYTNQTIISELTPKLVTE